MFELSYIVFRIVFCVVLLNQATSDYELAQSKPARQSTTYNNYTASMAVDGDPATYSMAAVGLGSVDIGWWQVDLGEIYKITRMTIVNSYAGFAYQSLSNYIVFIGSTNATDNTWEGVECYTNTSNTPVPQGGQISFNCSQQPTRGRYVTIRRYPASMSPSEYRQDMISLSEVYVYTNTNETDSTNASFTSLSPTATTTTFISPSSSTSKAASTSSSSTTTMLELLSASLDSNRFCELCPRSTQDSFQFQDSQRNVLIVGVILGSLLLISIVTNVCLWQRLSFSKTSKPSNQPVELEKPDNVAGSLTQSTPDHVYCMHLNSGSKNELYQSEDEVTFQGDNRRSTYTDQEFTHPDSNVYNEINTSMVTLNYPVDHLNIAHDKLSSNTYSTIMTSSPSPAIEIQNERND